MRTTVEIQTPFIDHSEQTAYIGIDKIPVDKNGVIVNSGNFSIDFFRDSIFLIIDNKGEEATMLIKAGDVFPNSILGDLKIPVLPGINAISIKDIKRFETSCREFVIDFSENFSGDMFAIADCLKKES